MFLRPDHNHEIRFGSSRLEYLSVFIWIDYHRLLLKPLWTTFRLHMNSILFCTENYHCVYTLIREQHLFTENCSNLKIRTQIIIRTIVSFHYFKKTKMERYANTFSANCHSLWHFSFLFYCSCKTNIVPCNTKLKIRASWDVFFFENDHNPNFWSRCRGCQDCWLKKDNVDLSCSFLNKYTKIQ